MPIAMARSNPPPPSLGKSAGAKLIVTRRLGKVKPELIIALRTLSRLSFTAFSGKPTRLKREKPGLRCTSTRTAGASMPNLVRAATMLKFIIINC